MTRADALIAARRAFTQETLDATRAAFRRELDARGAAEDTIFGAHTTLYAVGSSGRGDMGRGSDLDLYVVGEARPHPVQPNPPFLAAALSAAIAEVGLPPLDGEGKYAVPVPARSLLAHLGDPKDDSSGALTKRMLLLLESQPLFGEEAYAALLDQVLGAYWVTHQPSMERYLPFVLVNDIVRYWRTVLLNHESRIRAKLERSRAEGGGDFDDRAARLYSSYKLRIPRCLSCFSMLLSLAALECDAQNITRDDLLGLIRRTPIDRLRDIAARRDDARQSVARLEALYAGFLERTDRSKYETMAQLAEERDFARAVRDDGYAFTREVFALVQRLGDGGQVHQLMVV